MEKSSPAEKCSISGKTSGLIPSSRVRGHLADFIRKEHPSFDDKGFIADDVLADYRRRYIEQAILDDKGSLDRMEKDVVEAIQGNALISGDAVLNDDPALSFGQRLADQVAAFGGSWTFIITFAVILGCWIVLNSVILIHKPFDPYPYILLNLILSCLAALQAPVIMMSQNRQEAKDRQRGEYDYKVNLKAELEIRLLHEKIDHLMEHQQQRILELQQLQLDLLEELAGRKEQP